MCQELRIGWTRLSTSGRSEDSLSRCKNTCLSREQNRLTYLHELRHINDGDLYIADEADNIETKRHTQ